MRINTEATYIDNDCNDLCGVSGTFSRDGIDWVSIQYSCGLAVDVTASVFAESFQVVA